ncbi:MAG TPA: arylsulfatase [Opitutaceae bacterium]|nr:arylsulfatase [Opitutaceae bacterium]
MIFRSPGLALLALLSVIRLNAATAPERPPNIVVILADDLGWGDVSFQGAKLIRTPRIDALAREGRQFTQGYAPASVCSPTRYGILTGRFCWRTSLKRKTLPLEAPLHIEAGRMTVASLLKAHGYRTAAIGKWHLGYGEPPRLDWSRPIAPGPLEVGFDEHFGVPSNHGDSSHAYISGHSVYGVKPGATFKPLARGELSPALAEPRVDDLVNEKLTQHAVAFIEANRARPFYLHYTPTIPHAHHTPAPKFRGSSRAGLYGDVIQELDAHVGTIVDTLDRLGLRENTLVLFSSDNGGAISDFDGEGEASRLNLSEDPGGKVQATYMHARRDAQAAGHVINGGLGGAKGNVGEGGFRVPFVVRWPGRVPAGTKSDAVVCLTDLLATTAGILGAKLPDDAGEDSFDIGPALFEREPVTLKREALVLHAGSGVFAIRQGPWKMVERIDGAKKGRLQLYNLDADPVEKRDVQSEHPEIAARLLGLLDRFRSEGRSRPGM